MSRPKTSSASGVKDGAFSSRRTTSRQSRPRVGCPGLDCGANARWGVYETGASSLIAGRLMTTQPHNNTFEQTAGSHALAAAAQGDRYAAGKRERAEMSRDSSRREIPRINSDRIRRSSDTDGSPDSIFAMRDWLDWRRLARSACVRLRRRRLSRRPVASRTLRSIYAASSALRRRNSWAVPIFQPFACSRRRFSSRTVVLPQPAGSGVNDGLGHRLGLLAEDLQNHHRIGVEPIYDPPVNRGVTDPEFVTARTDDGHRPRPRHANQLPLLEQTKQIAGLDPRLLGERWRLDLSVKPNERLVARAHDHDSMSDPTCSQIAGCQSTPHNPGIHPPAFGRGRYRTSSPPA